MSSFRVHDSLSYGVTRWMVHRTGKYKLLNLIFGIFPFMAACFITQIREDSGPTQLWFSIVRGRCVAGVARTEFCNNFLSQIPLGFGNAVVLQTMLGTSVRSSHDDLN